MDSHLSESDRQYSHAHTNPHRTESYCFPCVHSCPPIGLWRCCTRAPAYSQTHPLGVIRAQACHLRSCLIPVFCGSGVVWLNSFNLTFVFVPFPHNRCQLRIISLRQWKMIRLHCIGCIPVRPDRWVANGDHHFIKVSVRVTFANVLLPDCWDAIHPTPSTCPYPFTVPICSRQCVPTWTWSLAQGNQIGCDW